MDFRGRVTLPMIGNYLIHAASSHAGERGFGFNDMSERHTAWVLSRLAIEMKEYPTAFDKINLYTWIDEVGRLFTSRCFELADENGKTFGFARSIWAAIDVETRRPTLLDIEALGKYIDERPCPIEKPGKIMPAENKAEGIPYSIKYSDLDINGHFNSVKYIEHLLDLFDIDQFKTREIGRLEIAYQSEGKQGMPLTLHKAESDPDKQDMAICHEGKAICRALRNPASALCCTRPENYSNKKPRYWATRVSAGDSARNRAACFRPRCRNRPAANRRTSRKRPA